MGNIKRREFIKKSLAIGAAAALPVIGRAQSAPAQSAQSASRVMGSNGDIRVAVIGFNAQGASHVNTYADKKIPGTRLVALCDVDAHVLGKMVDKVKLSGNDVQAYKDARELFDNKDIDAVVIATPHHWHCLLTIWGCQAGKDVYCEKPASHNIWEGRKMIEAAQKYNRIVQIGTQRRADTGWIAAAEYLKSGELGKILYSRGFCYKRRDTIGKVAAPTVVPDYIDYNLWCGPREKAPLMREKLHYDWHWQWPSGNGDLGNQGVHQMDVANWMIGATELPESVMSVGGRFGYVDDGQTANTQIVVLDYKPAPVIFEVRGLPMKSGMRAMDKYKGTDIGNVIECENGHIMESRAYDKAGKMIKDFKGTQGGNIKENFIECVRNRTPEKLVCPPAAGHVSAALCHMGNISYRVGQKADPDEIASSFKYDSGALDSFERFKEHLAANGIDLKTDKATMGPHLKFDPKSERFAGNGSLDDKANALVKDPYRDPFVIRKLFEKLPMTIDDAGESPLSPASIFQESPAAMQKKTIRAGIIGSGFAANFHCEALRRVHGANVEIAGVWSPTASKREAFAKRHELEVFDSVEKLLNRSDVIHVCSPPATHEPLGVMALERGKFAVIEKPFTGYFGDGSADFNGDAFPREAGLTQALASVRRLLEAEKKSAGKILYAENWVYAPAIQKEREIIEKTGAQILWMHGEESHSGSHSATYGIWRHSGGGSMMGKGCHPLTAALYLKHVEGRARAGKPIRPRSVTARVHAITRMPGFKNEGHLRDTYKDTEDFASMHIVFEDGTLADIFACELVMGGVHNWLEVNANNHRAICNINPNTAMQAYNPVEANFKDIYVVEKIGTKQGWSGISPDEDWFTGYQHEMEAFYRSAAHGDPVQSDSALAADTIATIYAGYVSAQKLGAEQPVPAVE